MEGGREGTGRERRGERELRGRGREGERGEGMEGDIRGER